MANETIIQLDADLRIPIYSPVCTTCRHLIDIAGRRCAAFPDGIPLVIWDGRNNHRTEYPGDHGIQYDPANPHHSQESGG